MLEIRTLEKVTFYQISASFNASFSDYFFPVKFTAEQFKDKFFSEGGRLDLSVGVFENEKLVAFILHFINYRNGKKLNYNGGTGVLPTFRGNRLTSKMYDFILPKLKDHNVDEMILEVLTQNSSALKIYQNVGFEIVREVNCFKGKLKTTNKDALYKIVELETLDWGKFQSFWDYHPAWTNSISAMNHLFEQNINIGIIKNDVIAGYLIYNPKMKRIHQLAVDKPYRNNGLGSQLLDYISKIEKADISCINIDSRTNGFKDFFEKRGLKNNMNQYEMKFKI